MEEGDRLLKSGRVEAALQAYQSVDDRSSGPLLERLSLCLLRLGRDELALAAADKAVRSDPTSSRAKLRRVQALLGLGRTEEARAECLLALEARPEHLVRPRRHPMAASQKLKALRQMLERIERRLRGEAEPEPVTYTGGHEHSHEHGGHEHSHEYGGHEHSHEHGGHGG